MSFFPELKTTKVDLYSSLGRLLHSFATNHATYSPDSRFLFVEESSDLPNPKLRLWNIASG
jgi:hypothetical protein